MSPYAGVDAISTDETKDVEATRCQTYPKRTDSFARNALLDDALCRYAHDRLRGRRARCWCRREGDGGHACHAALLIRVAHSDRAEMERLRQWARESMDELGEVAAAGERERWRSYRAANPVPAAGDWRRRWG